MDLPWLSWSLNEPPRVVNQISFLLFDHIALYGCTVVQDQCSIVALYFCITSQPVYPSTIHVHCIVVPDTSNICILHCTTLKVHMVYCKHMVAAGWLKSLILIARFIWWSPGLFRISALRTRLTNDARLTHLIKQEFPRASGSSPCRQSWAISEIRGWLQLLPRMQLLPTQTAPRAMDLLAVATKRDSSSKLEMNGPFSSNLDEWNASPALPPPFGTHLRVPIWMKDVSSGFRYLFSCIPEINNSAIISTYDHCSRIFKDTL